MMKILAGRACKSNDDIFLKEIKERIDSDPLSDILVIVPSQATYITEKFILDKLNLNGIMGLEVLSPERLTQKINDQICGRAKPVLDDAGKCMLFCLILSLNKDKLPLFTANKSISETAKDLCDLISETKIMDIAPEKLADFDTQDKDLKDKLKELSFIFAEFGKYPETCGITLQDKTNIAINHVEKYSKIKNSDIFIMGFDVFSEQFIKLIGKLNENAKSLTVAMLDSAPQGDDEVFALPKGYINRFVSKFKAEIVNIDKNAEMSADIKHIEQYIFAYPFQKKNSCGDVEIIKAENKEKEMMACAEKVAALINEGTKPCDIAVIAADIGVYSNYIKKYFGGACIPYFFDEKRLLSENTIADFILSSLKLCLGRLDKMRLLENINCGFYGSKDQQILIDRIIRTRIGNIYRIAKPFDNEKEEAARRACVAPVLDFIAKAKKKKTQSEILSLLIEFMKNSAAEAVLQQEEKLLREAGNLDAADYYAQLHDKFKSVLKTAKLFDGKADIKLLCDMLKSAFQNSSVGLIPVTADSVFFGNVEFSRLLEPKALFMLGCNEGVLPNYEEPQGLLSASQKSELLSSLSNQPESTEINKQKLAVYKMLSAPKSKLYVSYYESDDKDAAYPSCVITKICDILNITPVPAQEIIGKTLKFNAVETVKNAVRAELHDEDDAALKLLDVFKNDESVKEIIARCRDLFASPPPDFIPGDVAAELYSLTGSISKFQKYYACPYEFFMSYGLKPEVDNAPELKLNDVGTYIHDMLDLYIKNLDKDSVSIADLSDTELESRMSAVSAEVRGKSEKYSDTKENEFVLDLLEKEVLLVLRAIRKEKSVAASVIAATELEFNQKIGSTNISGTIDRVDTVEVDGKKYSSIIDYKSKETTFSLENLIKGLSLQLTLYMIAANNIFNSDTAGAGYINIEMKSFAEESSSDAIEKQYTTKGLHIEERRVLDEMFGLDGNRIVGLGMGITKKGTIHKTNAKTLYSKVELENMMKYTELKISQAAKEILGGNIKALPVANDKGNIDCRFCDYKTICGQAPTDKMAKEKLSREQAMAIIEKEVNL